MWSKLILKDLKLHFEKSSSKDFSTIYKFLMLKVRLVTRLHSDGFFRAKMIINVFFAVDLDNVK